jgi:hypothetical protein
MRILLNSVNTVTRERREEKSKKQTLRERGGNEALLIFDVEIERPRARALRERRGRKKVIEPRF